MKILVAHNAYQLRGGEDSVVESEIALLRQRGHSVLEYRRSNDEIGGMGRIRVAADTLWSRRTSTDLAASLRQERPQLLHVHNAFPLISPSLVWAAAAAGVPVVQTLHNFRLLCPQAMLLREGSVCERCLGRTAGGGARLLPRAVGADGGAGEHVDAAPLPMHLGAQGGPLHRAVRVMPRQLQPGRAGGRAVGGQAQICRSAAPQPLPRSDLLFVGRLSAEKGMAVLADAARWLPARNLRVGRLTSTTGS